MTVKICTAEWMVSDTGRLGLAPGWFPRLVAERMATSGRDGVVDRAPDPIPFIDAEMTWQNTSGSPQHLYVSVHTASRSLITSNPNTLALDDAVSFDVGVNPRATVPVGVASGVGGRLKTTRGNAALQYGRYMTDYEDSVMYVHVGEVPDGQAAQFRYRCLFSTPGEWRAAVNPRYEAYARWARLRMFASPMISGV